MQIIIIGCGNVGRTLADQLVKENHDVVIVDPHADRLNNLSEDIDCIKIVGSGGSISVLRDAGVDTADVLIAVTDSDELNLLCCLIAKRFKNIQTIARVRDPDYSREIEFIKKQMGISMIINPEHATAEEMAKILQFPTAIQIDSFSNGKIQLMKYRLGESSKLVGLKVYEVAMKLTSDVLIAGVERGDETFIPDGNFMLQKDDRISILSTPENSSVFFKQLGIDTHQVKSAIIVGGGTTAQYLATRLAELKINVKIIEKDRAKCDVLAEKLPDTLIIHGDGRDRGLLMEEGLTRTEALVSLTNLDEENIILSLYAKEITRAKLVSKVDRIDFRDVVEHLDIGSVIYPKFTTADHIIQYVRSMANNVGSSVGTFYHIMNGNAEALEFTIKEKSTVTDIPLKDIPLKDNLLIGCINRDGKVMIPRGNDSIQVGDTVVIVTTHQGLHDIRSIRRK